jgi:hypothetical protein
MTLLQDISSLSSIIFDIVVLLLFFSRKVRRYLFKAVILDMLYEILSDGEELERQIRMLRNVISVYNQFKKEEKSVEVEKSEKND